MMVAEFSLDSRDDSALLAAMAHRDMTALEHFYRRHQQRVYRFLLSRLNDPFVANDLLNDTMLEVWRAAGGFRGQSRATTWLLGIAHHRVLDYWRQQGRRPFEEIDESLPDETPNADIEAAIEAASDRAKLNDCLSRLTPEHREILHLVFFEELDYRDIGEILDIPEGTVKSRVFHAKKSIKRELTRVGRRTK
ncbi:RNA polymerase sigma factor [Halomonas lysinitropha]|uniref:RNA polymerase sigma factor YlaC n=1 Tax=Halomonas lysinitropha TaxID=2607506 RepID=A0A5K1I0R4_9GAMM|nr:sigma-70 family RNA polymerase sigma factor [Halomonas lysinitropha]VVZ95045.1 RNA polymerase sigma factor YlaC [Halomonas lysinitropha]